MLDLLTEEEKELLLDLNDMPVKPKPADDSSGSGQISPGGAILTGKRKKR